MTGGGRPTGAEAPRLLLLSTSTVHGSGFLEYALDELRGFLAVTRLLFVPHARPGGVSHDEYTARVREALAPLELEVDGLHESADPREAVEEAAALFVGGGNTFVLLRALHALEIMEAIRGRVAAGMPYLGASAGSNVAGLDIGTTNDMPVVQPPSFAALGLVPLNINPHYVDPDPGSTHMGETRETRIREFHVFNEQPVVGLREGAMLWRAGNRMEVRGSAGGRLFRPGRDPGELQPGADLGFLLDG